MSRVVESDVLYLAITHPTMKWGVPYEGICINGAAFYLWLTYIVRFNPVTVRFWVMLPIFPIVHIVMKILTDIDPHMFRILRLGVETRGIQLRGVSVLWAAPWRMRKAEDISSAV